MIGKEQLSACIHLHQYAFPLAHVQVDNLDHDLLLILE